MDNIVDKNPDYIDKFIITNILLMFNSINYYYYFFKYFDFEKIYI